MKAHIGVDSETGIVHSLSATAANVHDVTEAHRLLHGGETRVWCDAGYQGVHQREENLGRVRSKPATAPPEPTGRAEHPGNRPRKPGYFRDSPGSYQKSPRHSCSEVP